MMTKNMKTSLMRGGHREDLAPEGRVKGVYGAQNGITIIHTKRQAYYNAINIREGRARLCRVCDTPTDRRETGWADGAPIVEQVCPHCGVVYEEIVIQL